MSHENEAALVTGANSGLGFEAAAQLAEAGYGRVILVCRTEEKATAVRTKLLERTGKDVFDLLAMDAAELTSSARAAQELADRPGQIDLLVLNAGGGSKEKSTTSEGVELTLAKNLFGHHLLTMKLLEDFSEIARRPLFIPSRRPLPPDTEPPRPGPRKAERHRFTLKGVVIVADERMAVLVIQRRRSRTVLRVVEGQQIDGWLVEAILPDRVVLQQGETREEVALRDILKTRSRAKVRKAEPGTPTAPAAKRVSPTDAGKQDRPAGRPPAKSSGK